jgi:hypothetical protein
LKNSRTESLLAEQGGEETETSPATDITSPDQMPDELIETIRSLVEDAATTSEEPAVVEEEPAPETESPDETSSESEETSE